MSGNDAPGETQWQLDHENRERTFRVFIPESVTLKRAWPLVFAFHGNGTDALFMRQFCGLNRLAEREGFVVVYPNGSGRTRRKLSFHAGINCCGYALRHNVDDLGFSQKMLDVLMERLPIDSGQVYSTGMSNGGAMSYFLGDQLSDRIAAIAPVSAPMGNPSCSPQQPVSVCHFHGTEDAYVLFNGGLAPKSLTKRAFPSIPQSIRCWVEANGCSTEPEIQSLPTRIDDGTRVEKFLYSGGRDKSEVVLYKIHGMGHTWPGPIENETGLDLSALGATSQNVPTNNLIWEFFQKHRR